MKRFALVVILGIAVTLPLPAQSPAPVVVQAIPAAQAAPATATQATATAPSAALLNALQDMKAANDDVLAKQAATLQQLEEIEKAAEQLRIYSKRG
jgi:hypothetical protein